MKSLSLFYKADRKFKLHRVRSLSHFYRLCRQTGSQQCHHKHAQHCLSSPNWHSLYLFHCFCYNLNPPFRALSRLTFETRSSSCLSRGVAERKRTRRSYSRTSCCEHSSRSVWARLLIGLVLLAEMSCSSSLSRQAFLLRCMDKEIKKELQESHFLQLVIA